jgi:hypothetical protein
LGGYPNVRTQGARGLRGLERDLKVLAGMSMSPSELDALLASLSAHLRAAQDQLRGLGEEVETLRRQRDALTDELQLARDGTTPLPIAMPPEPPDPIEEADAMELEPLDDGTESTGVLPRWRSTGRTEREDQTDRVVLPPH